MATQPASGYAASGRAYPDVALSGFGYEVVIGESLYTVCGTSCSSPSVAAMASLVNAIRVEAGGSSLGFLNPALYKAAEASNVFNDVTQGENQCTAHGAVCCEQGFYAARGWDPTTGFGSVDYKNFKSHFTSDLDKAAVTAAEARLEARLQAQTTTTRKAPPLSAPAEAAPAATPAPTPAATPAPTPVSATSSAAPVAVAAPNAAETAAISTPLVVTLAAGGSALVGAAALYVHKFTKRVYAPRAEAADAPSTLYNAIASP